MTQKYRSVKYSTLTWCDKYRVEWFHHSHFRYRGQSRLTFYDPIDYSLQAPLSTGFSKQEYWSELPFPTPGDLPDPGIKPIPPALAGGFFTTAPPGKPHSEL